jgi:hypothetical protein
MAKTHRNISPQQEPPISNQMQQLLASLKLEGIEISPESMSDVRLFDTGKISKEEFLKRAIGRAKFKTG